MTPMLIELCRYKADFCRYKALSISLPLPNQLVILTDMYVITAACFLFLSSAGFVHPKNQSINSYIHVAWLTRLTANLSRRH